jgi:hypothetical protein
MHDEAHFGQMRDAPEVILGRHAIGRRGLNNRTCEVQQRRRNRDLKGVGQVRFIVSRLIDQSQVISASAAGALRVVDRPEVDMAASGQADFTEHAVTAHALDTAQGVSDGVQQWRQQRVTRSRKAAHGSSVSLSMVASLDPRRSKMRAKLGAPPCKKSAAMAIGMASERAISRSTRPSRRSSFTAAHHGARDPQGERASFPVRRSCRRDRPLGRRSEHHAPQVGSRHPSDVCRARGT